MTTIDKIYQKAQMPARTIEPVPVLHIIKSLGRGGAEMLLPETLNKHDKKKYEFHYIYFLPWKHQMVEALKTEGGKVTCFPSKNNAEIMLKVWQIANYVKVHKIRLIHCHMPWAGIIGRIVGKLKKVPVVYTEHNLWERYHKLTYHLNKLSFGYQAKVIAVSADVANSIRTNYKKNMPHLQVVLNGVNTDKFSRVHSFERDIRQELNIPAAATVIGITCVFRAQKRLTTWLEIAADLHMKHPGTIFIIVGDGVLKEEIYQKAASLEMGAYLHFVGLQAEIRPYLRAMDIFMMSSEFEGLPIALLEAMSMGCMPACTAAGGIPELIKDPGNGILVPVDKPGELVDRLSAYLDDKERIRQTGVLARETVIQSFGMQKMVTELEFIYNDLIK
jgi:glycosyltransferase involved in cell wall biosynthesis